MIHQPTNSRGNYNYNAYIYENVVWETHFHRNYELIYALEGENTITSGGRDFQLSKGELLLISPCVPHGFKINKGTKMWVSVFSSDFIASYAKKHEGKMYGKFTCEEQIEEYLKRYLFFQGTPDFFITKSCLFAVCDQCEKNGQVLLEQKDADLFNGIIRYISDNFSNDITLQEAAQALKYDYYYLSKLFHRHFGMNFKEFVNLYRYDKACEYLLDTSMTITDIALKSGFQSVRSFNRTFKQLSGKSPRLYRANK